jgi:hypothetical protein
MEIGQTIKNSKKGIIWAPANKLIKEIIPKPINVIIKTAEVFVSNEFSIIILSLVIIKVESSSSLISLFTIELKINFGIGALSPIACLKSYY